LAFVDYHLNIGVAHIYFFFDEADDPARSILESHDRVTCFGCDAAYWEEQDSIAGKAVPRDTVVRRQGHNAKLAFALARGAGYEWMLHTDIDEILYIETPLDVALHGLPRDVSAVQLPATEAVPARIDGSRPYREAEVFKVAPRRPSLSENLYVSPGDKLRIKAEEFSFSLRQQFARRLGAPRAFVNGLLFRGHMLGKMAVRTDCDIKSFGVHSVTPAPHVKLRIGFLPTGRMLHFDCWNYSVWERKWKWRYDGTGRSTTLGGERLRQFERFRRMYEQDDEQGLKDYFRELYLVGDEEQIVLKRLGLLRKISIPDALFAETMSG
jgi:hypothetical protein